MTDLQSGSYDVSVSTFNVHELIKNLVDEYSSSAKVKNLELKLDLKLEESLFESDEYALSHILSNLIDNSIKYTKKGVIKVSAKINNNGILEISIADTGIGIAEEFLPNLFNTFSQEEQGYTRSYDGNGLGLALVKNYCQLISADIKVNSIKEKGSTFTVTIPEFNNGN